MKVTEKGQVTIPKSIREKYGIGTNTEVEFVEEDHQIVLKKKDYEGHPINKVFGILNRHIGTDAILKEMRGE